MMVAINYSISILFISFQLKKIKYIINFDNQRLWSVRYDTTAPSLEGYCLFIFFSLTVSNREVFFFLLLLVY